MIYELPLVGFTTLAQTAVGAHIALSLYQWKNLDKPSRELHIARFIILGFMAIGFMCSTTHLAHRCARSTPLTAWVHRRYPMRS
ncbi:hypothetical protein JCM19236_978 [Vibrio sp. JCM 19236]|nr:hypothetical protein JCM19236_978 [Vibrio sp. JCM 19236]